MFRKKSSNRNLFIFLIICVLLVGCGNKVVNRAKSYMEIGDYSNAIEQLQEHLKKDTDDIVARETLIECFESTGDWTKEIEQVKIIKNLVKIDSYDYLLLRLYAQGEYWDKYTALKNKITMPQQDSLKTNDLLTAEGLNLLYEKDNEFLDVFEIIVERDSSYRRYIMKPMYKYLEEMIKPDPKKYYLSSEKFYTDIQNYHEIRGGIYHLLRDYENSIEEYSDMLFWFSYDEDSFYPAWLKYNQIVDVLIEAKMYQELRLLINQFLQKYAVDDTENNEFAKLWYMLADIPELPTLITEKVDNIYLNSAKCEALIVSNGNSKIQSKGVCWNKEISPTIENSFQIDISEGFAIKCDLIDLDKNSVYYVRSFAENENGIEYGNQIKIITPYEKNPQLTKPNASGISKTNCVIKGNVIGEGSSPVTESGICWSYKPLPTIAVNKIASKDLKEIKIKVEKLEPGTDYYFKCYAINNQGVGYGKQLKVTTKFETSTVTDIDGNEYKTVKIGDQWWMAEDLRVKKYTNGDFLTECNDLSSWKELYRGAYYKYVNGDDQRYLYNGTAISDNRGLAPEGWRVPSDDDWKKLELFLGMNKYALDLSDNRGMNEGEKLKSTSGWTLNRNGTDYCGFNSKPAGYIHSTSSKHYGRITSAYYWTNTKHYASFWIRYLSSDKKINRGTRSPKGGYSVRCVKDV